MMLRERGLKLGLKRRKRSNIYNHGNYSSLLEKGKEQEKLSKTNNEMNKSERRKIGFGLQKCSRKRSNICNHGDYSPLLEKGKEHEKRFKTNHDDDDVLLNKKNKSGGKAIKNGFGLLKCSQPQEEEEEEQESSQATVKVGDRVDLLDIVFTKHRDYLITYKDRNRPVQAKHLEGKFIILHFVPLVPLNAGYADVWLYITSLVDIYNALHPKGGFEVIFIGLKDGNYASKPKKLSKYFEKMLSIMPWTAIPDIKSSRYWERKLRFPLSNYVGELAGASCVIDPTGVLLTREADMFFTGYGAEGFPFTEDKLDFLDSQDEEALKHLSITALLTSPERDYVINNKGQAVPVHTLEDKVVALYFFQEKQHTNALVKVFKTVYLQLANAQNFEIVLVYVHDSLTTCRDASEELFWAHFNDMPWLALPFKDPKCKNLQRIFRIPMDVGRGPDPTLVIVGPGGKFFEPYGVDILSKFGISAFPFTRTRVAEIEAEFVRNLKMDRILDPNTSFTQENGSNVRLSQLLGERIILVVESCFSRATPKFWQRLRARYLQVKDTDAKFQVIHIHRKEEGPSCGEHVDATTSWLRRLTFHEESPISKLFFHLFRNRVGLLAFDCDGRVVRKTVYPEIKEGYMDFPFHAGGLEEVILADLVKQYEWDFWWD